MPRTTYFDIETAPLPDDQLERVKPIFEAPANYKDPEKIKANIAEQEAAWRDRAALDATTGRVLCIGVLDGEIFDCIDGFEANNEARGLKNFWMWLDTMQLALSHNVVGFAIFHFDLPFLLRRSWVHGVQVPMIVRRSSRWQPWHENIQDMAELWQCGNREQRVSLDTLAKTLGVGAKNGDGKDFAKLYATDKDAAFAYLRNDLNLTRDCWQRITGTPTP